MTDSKQTTWDEMYENTVRFLITNTDQKQRENKNVQFSETFSKHDTDDRMHNIMMGYIVQATSNYLKFAKSAGNNSV